MTDLCFSSFLQPPTQRLLGGDEETTPYLNAWRNNLTALSQVHDLYFVAYEDEIHAFRPKFPSYHLTDEAAVKLRLPKSTSHLPGHMPGSNSHSVNNLLVTFLGALEILVCVCDDGDVLAYYTSRFEAYVVAKAELRLATQRRDFSSASIRWEAHGDLQIQIESGITVSSRAENELLGKREALYDSAVRLQKPLLHSNVGHSAWGLAVHTEQCLIAVSANGGKIVIFQFALVNNQVPYGNLETDEDKARTDGFWNIKDCIRDNNPWYRHHNVRWTLPGHGTNIPSIAFDNGATGLYLISTDIGGVTMVWDVRSRERLQWMGPEGSHEAWGADFDPVNAGWGVISIDRRAFIPAQDPVTAMGTCSTVSCLNVFVADISHSRAVDGNRPPLRYDAKTRTLTTAADALDTEEAERAEEENLLDIDDLYHDISNHPYSTHHSYTPSESRRTLVLNQNGEIPHTTLTPTHAAMTPLAATLLAEATSYTPSYALQPPDTSPLLLLTPRTMTLLQSPSFRTRTRATPAIFFSDPLAQSCTSEQLAARLSPYDRMNLYHVIPELGVLLVGSQKGRVGVFTLRCLSENPFEEGGGSVCSMRLERVLPTEEQEVKGVRPMQPLVGLAAGPVRGGGAGAGAGGDKYAKGDLVGLSKWRVILMYRDHTMLSYEITRESAGYSAGLQVS